MGGAGYLGSALLKTLEPRRNLFITVIDSINWGRGHLAGMWDAPRVNFINQDLINGFDISGYDLIVNLAAVAGESLCIHDPSRAYAVNYSLPVKIASQLGIKQRMIHISSSAVYGDLRGKIANESTGINLAHLKTYARSKALADVALTSNRRVAILRLPTLYGISPLMRPWLIVHDLARDAVKNGIVTLYGKTDASRPFMHVSDAAMFILWAMENIDSILGQVKCRATENMTKGTLAQIIARHSGAEVMIAEGKDLAVQDHTLETSKGLLLANESWGILHYYRAVK